MRVHNRYHWIRRVTKYTSSGTTISMTRQISGKCTGFEYLPNIAVVGTVRRLIAQLLQSSQLLAHLPNIPSVQMSLLRIIQNTCINSVCKMHSFQFYKRGGSCIATVICWVNGLFLSASRSLNWPLYKGFCTTVRNELPPSSSSSSSSSSSPSSSSVTSRSYSEVSYFEPQRWDGPF